VRFNDFLFAAHGAAMTVIIYSQFFPQIWSFTIGTTQRVSRAVLSIFWGLVIWVIIVAFMAKFFGNDGGYDASGWAWIDVVSTVKSAKQRLFGNPGTVLWLSLSSRALPPSSMSGARERVVVAVA
jgi:hypothetical protein